jgi:inhibitor of KinA sporulation pathway (predicted exonuclease)
MYILFNITEKHITNFTGIFGAVWLILFAWLATNSPQKNRHMGDREKRYLKAEVAKYQFKSRKVWVNMSKFVKK